MSALREPVPFEVYEAGVYLHGTNADLAVGDLRTNLILRERERRHLARLGDVSERAR
jgi:hypothetical protein